MAERIDLPRSSVARLIKQYLPEVSGGPSGDFKLSSDVKGAFARAGGLFILYVANAADEACKQTGRTTVTAEDVLGGLEETDFDLLVQPTLDFLNAYRRKARGADGEPLPIKPTRPGGQGQKKAPSKKKSGSSSSSKGASSSSSKSSKKKKLPLASDGDRERKRVKGSIDLTAEAPPSGDVRPGDVHTAAREGASRS